MTSFLYAKGIDGVYGIKLGTSREEVKKSLEQMGWEEVSIDGYYKDNATYASLSVAALEVDYLLNQAVSFNIALDSYNVSDEDVYNVMQVICKNFNIKNENTLSIPFTLHCDNNIEIYCFKRKKTTVISVRNKNNVEYKIDKKTEEKILSDL